MTWGPAGEHLDHADSGCQTWVQGLDRAHVLRAFGADTVEIVDTSPHGADNDHLRLTATDVGWFIEEDPTFAQGMQPSVVRRASRGGRSASVYWNVDGLVLLCCSRGGRLVCYEDVSGPTADIDVPATLKRVLVRGEESGESSWASAARAARLFTRVAGPVDGAHPTVHRVTRPAVELRYADWVASCDDAPTPDIAAAARRATPQVLRRTAAWAVRRALAATELASVPAVVDAVRGLETEPPERLPTSFVLLAGDADRRAFQAEVDVSEADDTQGAAATLHFWSSRSWALQALAHASHQDARVAALGALQCLLVTQPELGDEALRQLVN